MDRRKPLVRPPVIAFLPDDRRWARPRLQGEMSDNARYGGEHVLVPIADFISASSAEADDTGQGRDDRRNDSADPVAHLVESWSRRRGTRR